MYVLKTRNVHKSVFQFLISSLKVLKDDPFLMFFEVKFYICHLLNIIVSVTYLTVFLSLEYRDLKLKRLFGVSLNEKKIFIIW